MSKRLPAPAVGQRFGRLRVVIPAGKGTRASGKEIPGISSLCLCDCGTLTVAQLAALYNGQKSSCGCLKIELLQKMKTASTKHGRSRTPTWNSWSAMKSRCDCPSDPFFHRYGARGITYCNAWKDFEVFNRDMGGRPEGTTLDRIDNEKGYCVDNCRWSSVLDQANNRSTTPFYEYKGRTQSLSDWVRELGVPYGRTYQRLKKGWSFANAVEANFQVTGQRRTQHQSVSGLIASRGTNT
jgi:hypothetical protein